MRSLTTCVSPQLLPLHDLTDKTVVVVDVLRATSSMITAFAHHVETITPVPTLAECRMLKSQGYVTAGERGGQKVQGFDLGNSPFDFMDHQLHGAKLAFTTTNGSKAIVLASEAKTVLIGAFLNLMATAEYLIAKNQPVLILCAGWKGKFNIEDTLYAGALAGRLSNHFSFDDDATLAAATLYKSVASNLSEFLGRSSHAQRLMGFENQKDLEFCMEHDKYMINAALQEDHLVRIN